MEEESSAFAVGAVRAISKIIASSCLGKSRKGTKDGGFERVGLPRPPHVQPPPLSIPPPPRGGNRHLAHEQ